MAEKWSGAPRRHRLPTGFSNATVDQQRYLFCCRHECGGHSDEFNGSAVDLNKWVFENGWARDIDCIHETRFIDFRGQPMTFAELEDEWRDSLPEPGGYRDYQTR